MTATTEAAEGIPTETSGPLPGRPPTGRRLLVLIIQLIVGGVIAGAFVGLYLGLQRDPAPRDLPVAVIGQEPATSLAASAGDAVQVFRAADEADATELVRTRVAVGAIVPVADGRELELLTAGADGRSATASLRAVADAYSTASGLRITTVRDVAPLARYDAQGIAGFYVVFGSTLSAFILAQILQSLAGMLSLRWRVAGAVGGAILAAAVVAVVAGPVLGAVPAPLAQVIPTLALLGSAVGLSTIAVATYLGPFGNILSTLLFTILGNATSGATISPHLMPEPLATIGSVLPPGAAFQAVVGFGYFNGAGSAGPVLILALWTAVALLALAAHHLSRRARASRTRT